ncbi:MAG TPA: 4Fe-4S ferredoxin [candidate division Zixibacteria bacterium]|nr:4Fe-4S ferredoxin [candidate division Zixibacteria bacterium]
MGHLVGKDLYRKLGKKIDGMTVRAPWNEAFYAILKELYTSEEAEVVIKLPYGIATLDQVIQATGIEKTKLKKLLDSLSVKGLIMDIWMKGQFYYTISPMVVGIFEFTMMRTGDDLNSKVWARLFNDYMHGNDAFYKDNYGRGQKVGPLRALPYEKAIGEHVEIFDYEKASAIVEGYKDFAVGLCSCRHEKLHLGAKKCDIPLETCTTMGPAAKHMAHKGFARLISKSEMLDNLARFREMGLVICADNVKKDVSFFCFCCGCCCNVMLGISEFGYPNAVVTSSFIAQKNADLCTSCGTCIKACPIKAISEKADSSPQIDIKFCMGCGVCALNCPSEAIKLEKRAQQVLHPETMFERVILQSLERGTLQNLIFANPQRADQKFIKLFVGSFLKLPPVKKALMSDSLRSSFLAFLQKGAGAN